MEEPYNAITLYSCNRGYQSLYLKKVTSNIHRTLLTEEVSLSQYINCNVKKLFIYLCPYFIGLPIFSRIFKAKIFVIKTCMMIRFILPVPFFCQGLKL